jgi:hypothetical protein
MHIIHLIVHSFLSIVLNEFTSLKNISSFYRNTNICIVSSLGYYEQNYEYSYTSFCC